MQITVSYEPGERAVAILRVVGEINVASADGLVEASRKALDDGHRNQLLDLTEVPYISSYGIRALSEIFTMLRTGQPGDDDASLDRDLRGGGFVVSHLKLLKPTPQVWKVLQLSGVDMFLECYQDRETAIAAFPA
ncbi:MAG TPA: STAS domain-containing protein [Anaerolineae bacterium]